MKWAFLLFAGIVSATIIAWLFGVWRWRRHQATFHRRILAAQLPATVKTYHSGELDALPAPVQRYFRAVLQEGQAIVTSVRLSQRGLFRQSEASNNWQAFHATQLVTTHPPGFDWDAQIRMLPGIDVFVRDAYVLGSGSLLAAVLGLVTVADLRNTPEIARGELMRYLAEAVWYPTALLPSQGVHWEYIDDSSASATLTDAATSVTLEFRFRADGLVATVWAASRPRSASESAPWLCRLDNYERRAGMYVPLDAEVEWQLPNGPAPYFRGHLTDIVHDFTTWRNC